MKPDCLKLGEKRRRFFGGSDAFNERLGRLKDWPNADFL